MKKKNGKENEILLADIWMILPQLASTVLFIIVLHWAQLNREYEAFS